MFLRFLGLCFVIVACKANLSPTEEYPHSAILDQDDRVKLYWKFDDVYITFEVRYGSTYTQVCMGLTSPQCALSEDSFYLKPE